MKRIITGLAIALCVLGALTSCQSTKAAEKTTEDFETWPIEPGQSLIQTNVLGFSPFAETGMTTIDFGLYFANAGSIKKWTVTIATDEGKKVKEYGGNGSYLPAYISWDGKKSAKEYADEGVYSASLSITYDKPMGKGDASTTPFILDISKPAATIKFTPETFSPMEKTDTIAIMIEGSKDLARIDSWTMDIFDPSWNLFATYSGKWPSNTVIWDGRGMNGEMVLSADTYPVIVRLHDEFGNVGTIAAAIPVDIIVIKDAAGYRIENTQIYFQDFTANYENVPLEISRQNIRRLDLLAEKLKKFPEYKILIVGHAVMINWADEKRGATEQEKVLLPLSKARALAIKKAMVARGIDPDKITTDGVGAMAQLVSDSDYMLRWMNRRTVIYLVK